MNLVNKIGLNSIVAQKPELDAVDMDGEKVMMNLDKGKYFGMNSVGSRIWDLISKPQSVINLISILLIEYDIDIKTCEDNVLTFLEKMYKEDLIYIS